MRWAISGWEESSFRWDTVTLIFVVPQLQSIELIWRPLLALGGRSEPVVTWLRWACGGNMVISPQKLPSVFSTLWLQLWSSSHTLQWGGLFSISCWNWLMDGSALTTHTLSVVKYCQGRQVHLNKLLLLTYLCCVLASSLSSSLWGLRRIFKESKMVILNDVGIRL